MKKKHIMENYIIRKYAQKKENKSLQKWYVLANAICLLEGCGGGLENVVFCYNYNYMDIIFLHHTTPHHTTPPQPKPLLTLQSDFHLYEIFAHTNPVIWHSIHSASYLLI